MQEEEVKFHKKVKVFSQKLQTNREIIDLDASDTEQMAEPADVLLAAEDADGYGASYHRFGAGGIDCYQTQHSPYDHQP